MVMPGKLCHRKKTTTCFIAVLFLAGLVYIAYNRRWPTTVIKKDGLLSEAGLNSYRANSVENAWNPVHWRKALVKRSCDKSEDPSLLSLVTRNHTLRFLMVHDKSKVLYCFIPKSGCTTWKYIMAQLTGNIHRKDFKKQYIGDLIPALHNAKYLRKLGLRFLNEVPANETKNIIQHYFKIIVVRHPFARLTSAYRDKFVIGDPEFRKIGKQIIKIQNNNAKSTNHKISFEGFVQLVIREHHIRKMNAHWDTYQNLCHPCTIQYDYIFNTETMASDFETVKLRLDPTGNLTLPHFQKSTNSTLHGSGQFYSVREFCNLKPSVVQTLYNIYAKDFEMFGYV